MARMRDNADSQENGGLIGAGTLALILIVVLLIWLL
jgi:hypothetical protein